MRTSLATIALILAAAPAFAHCCDLSPLTIAGSTAKSGDLAVGFGEPDNAQHPTAWQGPLTITVGTMPACTVSEDVAIVEQPVLLGRGALFVPTYSGSNNKLYILDVQTCKVLWQSPAYTGATTYTHGVLKMGAHSVQLNDECRPASAPAKQ